MGYHDSFWPSPEDAAEAKRESRQQSLIRAVIRHCAPHRLSEFNNPERLTPMLAYEELGVPYLLWSTDVTVDLVERNTLLSKPDKSRTVAAYDAATLHTSRAMEGVFTAASVRWPGWADQLIVCEQDAWPPTTTHIVLVTKRYRLVLVPLRNFLSSYEVMVYDQ